MSQLHNATAFHFFISKTLSGLESIILILMKAKKTRGFKKNLSFYRINFAYQPPYQLVFDGNFLKQMLDNNVDLDKVLIVILAANLQIH